MVLVLALVLLPMRDGLQGEDQNFFFKNFLFCPGLTEGVHSFVYVYVYVSRT